MNLMILIDNIKIFFRNFGVRHLNATLALAIGLTVPNAGQKIIARFARLVEWLRSRLRPRVAETWMEAQFQKPKVRAAEVSFRTTDCCAGC